MLGIAELDRCQLIAFRVAVIAQDARGGHVQRGILSCAVAINDRFWWGVRLADCDAYVSHVRIQCPIIGLVGEAVAASKAGGRSVSE